ncbi:MAG: hypothetical protein ACTSSQ_08030, partial [Alphaproteobacteria bacterium]
MSSVSRPVRNALPTVARFAVGLPIVVLLTAVLAACQVRPVYAPGFGGAPGPVIAELASVDIDDADGRTEQVFRNALLFGTRSAGDGGPSRYKLNYRLIIEEDPLGVEEFTGTTTS